MSTIVTRTGKGSALSWAEADANFTNLNNDKLEAATVHAATSKTTPVDADETMLSDSAASYGLKKLTWANIKATLKTYFDTLYQAAGSYLTAASIGTTVQGYDANTAKTNVTQSFANPQRSAPLTDNDLSFDLSAKQNFYCTPTAGGALTFTNIATGQSGYITLVNGSNYAITKGTGTKSDSSFLTTISATGTYTISYYSPDGTSVYVSATGAQS